MIREMKSYTDLEQSKKLAKILPIESADMYYHNRTDIPGNYPLPIVWKHNNPLLSQETPCWSLAALLNVIKPISENTYTLKGTLDGGATISFDEITNIMFQEEEIIDAVFEMVVLIKENKKL